VDKKEKEPLWLTRLKSRPVIATLIVVASLFTGAFGLFDDVGKAYDKVSRYFGFNSEARAELLRRNQRLFELGRELAMLGDALVDAQANDEKNNDHRMDAVDEHSAAIATYMAKLHLELDARRVQPSPYDPMLIHHPEPPSAYQILVLQDYGTEARTILNIGFGLEVTWADWVKIELPLQVQKKRDDPDLAKAEAQALRDDLRYYFRDATSIRWPSPHIRSENADPLADRDAVLEDMDEYRARLLRFVYPGVEIGPLL
jgi:hypothetical protein